MPNLVLVLADILAVGLLTFVLYLPRHRRRDLAVAYLGVNVGVLAVAASLSSSAVGAGLGLGLFGVLSIIRLRSTELSHREVAYYFSALALGLLGGLTVTTPAVSIAFMGLVVVVMYLGDHPRLLPNLRSQTVMVDRAISREDDLTAHLTELVGGRVHSASVQRLDLVNDTTLVDVRYSIPRTRRRSSRRATSTDPAVSVSASSGTAQTPDPAARTHAGVSSLAGAGRVSR